MGTEPEDRSERDTPALSEREQQILNLATNGYTDTAIANKLGISEATVGTYWGRVRIKMGPYSRTELVARALQHESAITLDSLRAENAKLVAQMQALNFANVDEQSINLAKQVIENAGDAILVVNKEGIIEFVNQMALELFGYERIDLLGERVTKLIPDRFRHDHDDHRASYMANAEKRQMGEHLSTPAVRADGTEFPIAASLSPVDSPSGMLVTCIVRAVGLVDESTTFAPE